MSLPPLKEVGVSKFETIVFEQVQADVCASVLSLIERERAGELVDRQKIQETIAVARIGFLRRSDSLFRFLSRSETGAHSFLCATGRSWEISGCRL